MVRHPRAIFLWPNVYSKNKADSTGGQSSTFSLEYTIYRYFDRRVSPSISHYLRLPRCTSLTAAKGISLNFR